MLNSTTFPWQYGYNYTTTTKKNANTFDIAISAENRNEEKKMTVFVYVYKSWIVDIVRFVCVCILLSNFSISSVQGDRRATAAILYGYMYSRKRQMHFPELRICTEFLLYFFLSLSLSRSLSFHLIHFDHFWLDISFE